MLTVALEPVRDEAAGWQLLDARTGKLIEEGAWVRERANSEVPVPADDGDYRILVSTVDEKRGWAYTRGEKMRVLDVAMRGGVMRVERDRQTTMRGLRLEGLPRRTMAFLAEPWTLIWSQRSLIEAMVRRDFTGRYRGSFGDRFWSITHPLLLMLTYWFVFGVVLQSRLSGHSEPQWFVLYFLCGMLPWLAFSEALGRAPTVVLEHRNLVKKLVFPVEILPVNLVLSGLMTGLAATVVYLFFQMAIVGKLPVEALLIPVLLILPQLLLTVGLCWAAGAVGVFARDLAQINGFLITLWFFLTPICYSADLLPAWAMPVLGKNPMFVVVQAYRGMFIDHDMVLLRTVGRLWMTALVVFYGGYGVFRKLRPSFPDVL